MRVNDWRELNDSLIKNKIPFSVEKTTMTIKFFTPYGQFEFFTVNDNSLPPHELFFIKKVKDHAETLNLTFDIDRERIKYIQLPRLKPETEIENLIEIDLSSAYWNFAHHEKIISDEIFEAGSTGYTTRKGEHRIISKRTRLASIGALAKLTHSLSFDGENWHIGELTEGERANYFFKVAERTGEVMEDLRMITETDFILYWVDAIFFKPRALAEVEKYLHSRELKFKKYKIEKIVSHEKFLRVFSEQHRKEKDTAKNYRDFFYKKETFDLLNKHTKHHRHR